MVHEYVTPVLRENKFDRSSKISSQYMISRLCYQVTAESIGAKLYLKTITKAAFVLQYPIVVLVQAQLIIVSPLFNFS